MKRKTARKENTINSPEIREIMQSATMLVYSCTESLFFSHS